MVVYLSKFKTKYAIIAEFQCALIINQLQL